jgi:hypothetical protein
MDATKNESEVDRLQRMVIQALANPSHQKHRGGLVSAAPAEFACWLPYRDMARELMGASGPGSKDRRR